MSDHLRMNKRYLIILAGLILAGVAGITLHQKIRLNQRRVAAKTKVVTKKVTLSKRPAHLLDKKPVVSNRVEKKSLIRKKEIIPDHAKKEAKMPPAPVYTSRAAPSIGIDRKEMPQKQAEKRTRVEKEIEKHEPRVKAERFASVPVKRSSETRIEIQAIAWSKNPKGRLAVINGLILREGESIDNVMVVDIGKDAVVFEKDRQEWKQMFGF